MPNLRRSVFFGRNKNPATRIGILMQYFQPGGLEKMVFSLAKGLKERNMEPRVAAYLEDGPMADQFEQAGIPTKLLSAGSGLQARLPIYIARWLTSEKIDICHTHHLGPYLYATPACQTLGVPMVHTEHSREFYDRPRRKILGWSMNQFSRVVVVSPELARFRREQLYRESDIIPNGVAIPPPTSPEQRKAARKKINLPARSFVIGCVARLAPEKDHHTLLEAFSLFLKTRSQASLVIVGSGPSEKQILEWISKSAAKNRIHMLGYRDDMYEILPAFDTVALPSLREGLPLALLEAMAHALPVVATRVGAIPELLENGGGLTVDTQDTQAMANCFEKLASDAPFRKKSGRIARKLVSERYSLDAMVDAYHQLYQSMLSMDTTQ